MMMFFFQRRKLRLREEKRCSQVRGRPGFGSRMHAQAVPDLPLRSHTKFGPSRYSLGSVTWMSS